jgi:leucyl/phenylalanyl-tRNA--protein transferase
MAIVEFPPRESADEEGLLAIGGDLEVVSLLKAYSEGIFPWPISKDYPLAWFSPNPRGILRYEDLKISKSLKKLLNKKKFDLRFNQNFEAVIKACSLSKNRKGQTSTWITDEIINGYINLHHAGFAYSAETYNSSNQLVGGVYGVALEGFVTGESMFYLESNASKVALVGLMEHLKALGISWIDTQMITPVVENLGGVEIDRPQFLKRLKDSLRLNISAFNVDQQAGK